MIRKGEEKDIDSIETIYGKILEREEKGLASIGWQRGVYPTRETARQGVGRGDMYVYEDDATHNILAAGVINKMQLPIYAEGKWDIEATDDEVMVLHTLVVDPETAGRGIGKTFLAFYEKAGRDGGCKALRIDTQAKNVTARALYGKLGYKEIGTLPCDSFNGIGSIELVLLEKALV